MLTSNDLITKSENPCFSQGIKPFFKYPLESEPQDLTPREFCRRMHGLSGLPEVEILRAEMEHGYRKRCIGILSKALGVQRQSVHNWGSGLDFDKMPRIHRRSLGMCWERYALLLEVKRLRRFTT